MTGDPRRYALILAAGKGTRFRSDRPKVLHTLCGKPMIAYLLERMPDLGIDQTFVVVGEGGEQVQRALKDYELQYVHQSKQLGTGHAVLAALPQIRKLSGSLIILYGDTPLIETASMLSLLETRERSGAAEALLTVEVDDPTGYGRIIRDDQGRIRDIIEEKEASQEQKRVREINPGFVCFDIDSLVKHSSSLSNENEAEEYYLTDMVKILYENGEAVETLLIEADDALIGINDREQLAQADHRLHQKINQKWMRAGVTIKDPSATYIDSQVSLSVDCIIYPGVTIEGNCTIAERVTIYSNTHLRDVDIGADSVVDHSSVIRESMIGSSTRVGPFAHLRSSTRVGNNSHIGNYVEIKNSSLGNNCTAAHLSYLGDAQIGNNVNIGAGTITCNFDGVKKNATVIEDNCFIGSGSQLIAPIKVGHGSTIAAGSTVTKTVPPNSLAIARGHQVNKEGWKPKTQE